MRASVRNAAESITKAILPATREHPPNDVLPAMCVVLAKLIVSCSNRQNYEAVSDMVCETICKCVDDFSVLSDVNENEERTKKAKLDSGINGFDRFGLGESGD